MMRNSRGPAAVVDIGSNSVRLVVYESQTRAPATVHNEKAICSIGRDMVTTGRLHGPGMEMALEVLGRFKILADALQVTTREAVATAAARDAENGQEFIRKAEAAWGAPIRVLSGEEEARLAAEGVLAGIPDADGLVADLGGGSLDMVTVKGGRMGEAYTLPFGPLRLIDQAKGNPNKARDPRRRGACEASQPARAREACALRRRRHLAQRRARRYGPAHLSVARAAALRDPALARASAVRRAVGAVEEVARDAQIGVEAARRDAALRRHRARARAAGHESRPHRDFRLRPARRHPARAAS